MLELGLPLGDEGPGVARPAGQVLELVEVEVEHVVGVVHEPASTSAVPSRWMAWRSRPSVSCSMRWLWFSIALTRAMAARWARSSFGQTSASPEARRSLRTARWRARFGRRLALVEAVEVGLGVHVDELAHRARVDRPGDVAEARRRAVAPAGAGAEAVEELGELVLERRVAVALQPGEVAQPLEEPAGGVVEALEEQPRRRWPIRR